MNGLATGKPQVACEILPDRVLAARASADRRSLDVVSSRVLEDKPQTATAEPAFKNSEGLRAAIASALSTVTGSRNRELIALLPDSAVRTLLLDFEEFPQKAQDAEAVVRLRLKKALPFDAEKCSLSFQTFRVNNSVKVLAVVTPRETLNEFEAAFRDLGYFPGVVLPSSVALLGAVPADQPTLVVKSDGLSAAILVADRENLLLHRSLDFALGRADGAQDLADAVYTSMIFVEDSCATRIAEILLAGLFPYDFAQRLEAQTGIAPRALQPPAHSGALGDESKSLLAPLSGALLG